ncbi:MAG TPA: 2-oxo acid dehydrogenase subunit E2 [Anaeromyxobacteraceae bacterium]|nr:2-oxo acid dehydrogenase subunit E2 [Anaeromyxobacteraceae bacterium]
MATVAGPAASLPIDIGTPSGDRLAMPLFRRADGDLVRDLPPVRGIVPYLMRRRNESAVYHEARYDVGRARRWLRAYNRAHEERATLFHLLLYACTRALHLRPGLNRFVSGGRVYARRGVSVAFAAKREMSDEAPFATVKLAFGAEETLGESVRRVAEAVDAGRAATPRAIDREAALVMSLPGFLVSFLTRLAARLDAWNLLPGFMMRDDPFFSSLFLANLGSVGLSDTFHHLYEYGTVSIFGVMGTVRPALEAGPSGAERREILQVRFTLDERVNDGFYAARSLRIAQDVLEDPDRYLGPPDAPVVPTPEAWAALRARGEARTPAEPAPG